MEPPLHVVTGAFGYSGQYIARRLLDKGIAVRTLTNSPDRENPFGGQVQAFAHGLVDAARVRFVVAQRQEQRVRMLQEGAGMAHDGVAQHAQLGHQRARRRPGR